MKRLAVVVLLLLLAVAAVLAARVYLSSSAAARHVGASLESILGLPATVESASIGLASGSSVRGLSIDDPDQPGTPLLTVEDVEADLTAFAALAGKLPRRLTLTGVHLTLRFGKDGKLLTRLPEFSQGHDRVLPRIELRHARITLAQQGRPPFVLRGDPLEISSEEGRETIQGSVHHDDWGTWAVSGGLTNGAAALALTTDGVAVTRRMLTELPFVPPAVWEQVSVEGRTSGKLTLGYDPQKKEIRYRVEASPRDARVRVSSIDLVTSATSGEVVVEDGLVRLRRVSGRTADGSIRGDADLDFRGPGADMSFRVAAQGLAVAQLPRAWGLPIQSGRLTGSADLTLQVRDGKLRTAGEGKGTISGVEFAGGTGTIGLRLHAEGGRFRFRSAPAAPAREEDPEARARAGKPLLALRAQALLTVALQPPPAPLDLPQPEALASWLTSAAADALVALGRTTNRALRRGAELAEKIAHGPAPGEAPTYLEANLSFQDVQLKQLVERLALPLPFPVEGRLSFALKVELPVNTPRDLKAYRLRGSIDVATLQLAGLTFEATRARLDYRDGTLVLEELAGRLPSAVKPGAFIGKARLQVVPLGDLALQLAIDGFDLASLSRLPPEVRLPVQLGGAARLEATVTGPLRLQEIAARGTLRATDLTVEKLRLGTAEVRWSLQKALLGIEIVRGKVYGGEITGSASLPLRQEDAGVLDLALKGVDVAQAVKALTDTTLPIRGRLSGTVKGAVTAAKADQPRSVRASIDVTAPQLRIQNIPAERVRGNLRYLQGRVEYQLEADALGGKVRIDGQLPPARPPRGGPTGRLFGPGRFRVLLRQVEADELLPQLGLPRGAVVGRFDAELRGVGNSEWYGGGIATLTQGRLYDVPLRDWRLPLSFRLAPAYGRGEWTLDDSSFQVAQGRATLRGSAAWSGPEGLRLDGRLRVVEARLAGLVEALGSYAEGRVTATVDFSGEGVRSANDLRANIQATLQGGSRAQQMPVLAQVAPYLSPAGRSATFRDGRMEARLGNGVVRVQRVELNGDLLDVFAQGAVTLRGGLDLSVTARTETPAGNPVLLRLLALQVPAIGPVPTVVLVRASALLAKRVVHLRVTGTIAHPQVNVEPIRLLTDEAARFFLTRVLLPR